VRQLGEENRLRSVMLLSDYLGADGTATSQQWYAGKERGHSRTRMTLAA
jgi:hypothetical protein